MPEFWQLEIDTDTEFRTCHLKIYHFGILIILSCRHWKNSKYKEGLSLNSPYLPEDGTSKGNSTVIDPLPRSFINQGKLTVITENTRSQYHPQTLSPTILPPIYSSKNLSFLKIIYSPIRGLHFYSPFPIRMVIKPEF